MITVDGLIEAGYKEYKPHPILTSADRAFQKKFTDDTGVRYHISVYAFDTYDYDGILGYSFDANLNFRKILGGADVSVEQKIYGFMHQEEGERKSLVSIADIEAEVEHTWVANDYKYYEIY